MSKPSPAAVAAMNKVGGIFTGLVEVAKFLGRDEASSSREVAGAVDAVAQHLATAACRAAPAGAPSSEPAVSDRCPIPQGAGWRCLLRPGHPGGCTAGRDEDDR